MTNKKDETLRGLELQAKDTYRLVEKYEKLKERYQVRHHIYEMFCNCLRAPHKVKIDDVQKFIITAKEQLNESDLMEFRKLYEALAEELDVFMGNELGAKRV